MKDLKICGIRSAFVWGVFIGLLVTIFAFMIASLTVEEWVELQPDTDGEKVYKFKGDLLKLVDGLDKAPNPMVPLETGLTVDLSDLIYAKVSCASDFILNLRPDGPLTPSNRFFKSWRDLFYSLWLAGGVYLIFEINAIVCSFIVIGTLLLFYKNIFYFNLNFCASVCVWISHIIAIISWIAIVKPSFDDDCEDLTDGVNPPTVCALDGPRLGLFVLIYSSVVMIPYYIVFSIFVHKFDSKHLSTAESITKRSNEQEHLKDKI